MISIERATQHRTIPDKKLVGKRLTMTFADDKTGELWQSFMPKAKEISNKLSSDLISMQLYGESFDFNPTTGFEKWAAVGVRDFDQLPDHLETYLLKGGLYAVFFYKGLNTDTRIFQYIFTEWLPGSDYRLDTRPHVEVLGEKYKNGSADSEEEIWIPIVLK